MVTRLLWRGFVEGCCYIILCQAIYGIYQNLYNRLICPVKLTHGAIAQLVEHLHGMQGVSGSSPLGSIGI